MAERPQDVMTSVACNDLLGNSKQFCSLFVFFLMLFPMQLCGKLALY